MNNIIEFPPAISRDKRKWDNQIAEVIHLIKKQSPMTDELEKLLSERLVEVALDSQKDFNFSLSIEMPSTVSQEDSTKIQSSIQDEVRRLGDAFQKYSQEMRMKRMACEGINCMLEYNNNPQ